MVIGVMAVDEFGMFYPFSGRTVGEDDEDEGDEDDEG